MGTIVSAQNVTKIYQMDKVHVVALDGVSFSIDEGNLSRSWGHRLRQEYSDELNRVPRQAHLGVDLH
jgi:hypothetical protein